MQKDIEIWVVEYNNSAARFYESACQQLVQSLKGARRDTDEKNYKLLQGKYLFHLKNQLEQLANETLEKSHTSHLYHPLRSALTARVIFYLTEFRHKANSL